MAPSHSEPPLSQGSKLSGKSWLNKAGHVSLCPTYPVPLTSALLHRALMPNCIRLRWLWTVFLTFALLVNVVFAQAGTPSIWSLVQQPTSGATASAIGGPSNGCLSGAQSLETSGVGFVSIRRNRHRYFAHPLTLAFVRELGLSTAETTGRLMMVGDLAQPRGGLMDSFHRSHQNGLDVDIWFTLADSPEQAWAHTPEGRNPRSMVREDGRTLSDAWGVEQRHLLHATATHPDVDRLFVNPAIKQALCERESNPAWLQKLRPWRGHAAHFHVRLRCPLDSPQCEPQSPLPAGSGCDDSLAWWFSKEAHSPSSSSGTYQPPPSPPAACAAILNEP